MASAAGIQRLLGDMIAPPSPRQRVSPAKRRTEIRDAQIAALNEAITEIRRKAREMPAWAHGYNSAITAIELQIERVRAAY